MKVTTREKNLLVFLIVFATAIVGFMFVFTPMKDAIDNDKEELKKIREEEDKIDNAIDSYKSIEDSLEEKADKIAQESSYMFDFKSTIETDAYVQSFTSGVTVKDLRMSAVNKADGTTKVELAVSGTQAQINAVIQAINSNTKSITIDNISVQDADGNVNATFALTVYAVDKDAING